jgi:hypothetical protein
MRIRIGLMTFVLVTFAGCRSVEWQEVRAGSAWHGLRLHRAGLGAVAARDEDAASDVYFMLEDLLAAMQRHGIANPCPVLAIAVSYSDPPLLGDPLHTGRQLQLWHRLRIDEDTGCTSPGEDDAAIGAEDHVVPEQVARVAVHAVAASIPLDAPELSLPDDWRESARWAVVVPTTDCLDRTADAIVDMALEDSEITVPQRILMAPFIPFMRSQARTQLRRLAVSQVFDAAVAAARGLAPVDAGAIQAVREELDLEPGVTITGMQEPRHAPLDPAPPEPELQPPHASRLR